MNSKEFAAITTQIASAAQAPVMAAPQIAAWLGIVEALAKGHLTLAPVAPPEAKDAEPS